MKKNLLIMILTTALLIAGCAGNTAGTQQTAAPEAGGNEEEAGEAVEAEVEETAEEAGADAEAETDEAAASAGTTDSSAETASANGNIVILYTNDVHCSIDGNIGYDGLAAYKKEMQKEGNAVFLVDDGDEIQGGTMGAITKGESIIKLMNATGYDLAIPGNHEFDYGIDQYMKLVGEADFPIISCNFEDLRTGELMLDPYVIEEIGGKRIGFVGATTPDTITSSTPTFFKDENGEFIYGFSQNEDGTKFYEAVQKAVDAVNAEGVDYTILIGHLGIEESSKPYTSVDVIRNTTGIDVVLDGHSHSTVPMEDVKNKDGEEVILTQTGSHLEAIGKLTIDVAGNIRSELVTDWTEKDPEVTQAIADEKAVFAEILSEKIISTDFELAAMENDIWLVRNNETNLGDLMADSIRTATGADVGFVNGGGIRSNIEAGDVTYEDLMTVAPFCNEVCIVKATGQMIADALEYSVCYAPDMTGGFLQVSGLTFDIDLDKNPQVKLDENGLFVEFESDERRVSNIMIGGEPLDPEKEYTVGSSAYILHNQGNGYTMFDEAERLDMPKYMEDLEALVEYMRGMGDTVSEEYADRYGQERMHFLNE